MIPNKKSSIILVLKILQEYTDEEHYLTQIKIADKIKQIYDIELERKSIGSSIQLLEELDYDIVKIPKKGVALLSRTFDQTEATYLIDAIFSSKSISSKEAKKITDAISSCFSKYQRRDYSYIHKSNEINRTFNKDILFNLNIINEAIKQKKRIEFQYLTYDKYGNQIPRNDGYKYIVSPYYLINNFGRYYLLCNYREKYKALQTFRIDYMTNIQIKDDWEIKKITNLKGIPSNFSITKYINEHPYMYSGEVIDVVLELDNENAITYVKDWFGENTKIELKDSKILAKVHSNEESIYFWAMQYSDSIKVISPQSLKLKIIEGLKRALDKYELE